MELHMILLTFVLALVVCTNNTAVEAITTTRHDLDGAGGSSSSKLLCVHRTSTQAYDGVVALKDGSGRLVLWNKNGQIWFPAQGYALRKGDKPLIDLGSRLSQDAAARGRGLGLAGVALHYSTARLFVSYYTTTVGPDGGSAAFFLVVDELSSPSGWREAQATLTRRVFSMALPEAAEPRSSSAFHVDYYAGQIMSRPTSSDPYIYIVTGPAHSDGQLQAQILRFRVDDDEENASGNGTITPLAPAQLYVAWLGIPRRCAFDSDRSQDMYCAIFKDDAELVYLISDPGAPSSSAATPPRPTLLVAQQRPMPPTIVGGLLYRGDADTTLSGSYIYMDRSKLWLTVTSPNRNHSVARDIRVTCSASTTSPSSCGGGGDFTGTVKSFGEDAENNALLLTTDGAYLVVGPTLCDTNPKAPTSKNLLKWVLVAIGTLVGSLLTGYGAYKIIVNCCTNNHEVNPQIEMTGNDNNINVENNYTYIYGRN